MKNKMKLVLPALSKNEAFARSTVAAFAVELPFTLEDINDIKTAVSEAVTNAIVHGYEGDDSENVIIEAELHKNKIVVTVTDSGVGIDKIDEAMQPFYTTKPEQERSGMGFTIMGAFMDKLEVNSVKNSGTVVKFEKKVTETNDMVS